MKQWKLALLACYNKLSQVKLELAVAVGDVAAGMDIAHTQQQVA